MKSVLVTMKEILNIVYHHTMNIVADVIQENCL